MYIVYNDRKEILYYSEVIYYVRFDEESNEYVECPKELSDYIYIKAKDEMYDAKDDIATISQEIKDFKPRKYLYKNGKVIDNPNYVPYISDRDRISALEDMVNMLLGV